MGAELSRRRYARKVEIDRAMKAVEANGMALASVELLPDGRIVLHAAPPGGVPQNDFDRFESEL